MIYAITLNGTRVLLPSLAQAATPSYATCEIHITESLEVSDTTVIANALLVIEISGGLVIASGETLTINCPFSGDLAQLSGAGTIVYGALFEHVQGPMAGYALLGANTFSGPQNTSQATVASHATTADIWGAAGNQILWTGTETTTAFPNAPQAGAERVLICASSCAFTAGTDLIIDGVGSGLTVTCAPFDAVIVRALSTTQFKLSRIKSDGTAQVSSPGYTGGLNTAWIPAGAMVARTTSGSASGTVEMATNKNMFKTLDFDTATVEYAQFAIQMPKSWNGGTVTAAFVWSHAATTTNFGVAFGLQGVAISNDDAGDVAFGTGVLAVDTGGTTNDIYVSPTTTAITVGGTPAERDYVMFQVYRAVADGGDTMAIDARLHGVQLFYTTNAATDA